MAAQVPNITIEPDTHLFRGGVYEMLKNANPEILGKIALILGMFLIASAYAPVIRRLLGLDTNATLIGVLIMLIGGLMAGLSGMMLLARHEADLPVPEGASHERERRIASLCHLGAPLVWCGIPLGNFLLPYVFWKRGRQMSGFVDQHGAASINFQISVTLYLLIAVLLFYLVVGLVLLWALALFHIVLSLVAAARAGKGESYQYPMAIRFIQA